MNNELFKRRINCLLNKYKKKLLISKSWTIKYKILNSPGNYAEVQYDYQKREFIININKKLNISEKNLKDTVIHELFHIFLSPYVDTTMNALEQAKNGQTIKYGTLLKRLNNIEESLVNKLTKILLKMEIKNDTKR